MSRLACLKSILRESGMAEAFINQCFRHLGLSDSVQMVGSSLEGDWGTDEVSLALVEIAFLDEHSLLFIAKRVGIGDYLSDLEFQEGILTPELAELKTAIAQIPDHPENL